MRSRGTWLAMVALALTGCSIGAEPRPPSADPTVAQPADAVEPSDAVEEVVETPTPFDLTRHSTTDPGSTWVVVNKRRALRPTTFEPDLAIVEGYQVHPRVVRPLARLLAVGRRTGLDLRIMSAYRSSGRQGYLYATAVAALGQARADLTTARAGHSEHQTGLAVDLGRATTGECNVTACFAGTREARWLKQNAHRFGFVLRYPERRQADDRIRPRELALPLRRPAAGVVPPA